MMCTQKLKNLTMFEEYVPEIANSGTYRIQRVPGLWLLQPDSITHEQILQGQIR